MRLCAAGGERSAVSGAGRVRGGRGRARTRKVDGQEAVAAREADGVGEDRPGDRVPRAQARPRHGHLGLLRLQTDL